MAFIVSIAFWAFPIAFACFLIDRIISGETFQTSEEAVKVHLAELERRNFTADSLFIDLGSCYGRDVCAIQRNFPHLRVIGVDNSPVRILISKLRTVFMTKRPDFVCKNLFSYPLDKATILNVYLPREMLDAVAKKIKNECRKGILVLTYRVPMPGMTCIFKKQLSTYRSNSDEVVYIYEV